MSIENLKDGQRISIKQLNEMGIDISSGRGKGKRASRPQLKTSSESISSKDFSSLTNNELQSNHKYNAKVTYVDGIRFDSKWEADRYCQLKILEKSGEVTDLELQVEYKIMINDVLVTKYIADFVYIMGEKKIVEDAKGFITPEYRIKKNLMLAVNGIEIYETRAKTKYRRRKTK